jgi:hypothetical protein
VRHVLGLSGGKDSAALAVFMRERFPEVDTEYFFTDTGNELPEVMEFLGRLEGHLGKPIHYLNPGRPFEFWLREYGHFLPSPSTRWCTRQLKLAPFRTWINRWLDAGDTVISYVAIRADEDHRDAMTSTHPKLHIKLPFREHGIDKEAVWDILESSGLGAPAYYKWRSRSGCTFCFFQQKIEWVRLRQVHPTAFEHAKSLEKSALEHGSPFTWTQGESLTDLEQPSRVAEIINDFEARRRREQEKRYPNPLRQTGGRRPIDIDELYLDDEGGGACLICHK